MADDKGSRAVAPRPFVEPPIPTTTEFTDAAHVRGVIQELDQGNFRRPSLLLERMMMNPRLRGVVNTRLAGLVATEIRFEPARNNKECRRVAKALEKDWPHIAPATMRKQMLGPALFLGLGVGQRHHGMAPTGREVFSLRPYWTGFASWYWAQQAYRIQTFTGVTEAATPSFDRGREAYVSSPLFRPVPPADESPWVISEPFGVNSYRHGIIHAAWRPWLGHDWSMRDQARASQKHGVGIFRAQFPRGQGDEHKESVARFLRALQKMSSEGVVPEEELDNGSKFQCKALEFNGSGFQAIDSTLMANAVALAILLLGHNLTTEVSRGGSYAAIGVADFIRDDIKHEDAATEWAYMGPQLITPWCVANFGDPSLVPIARYVTDSPTISLQRAQMIYYLGQAAAQLRANVPRVDLEALAEEFQLPMLDERIQVQVPGNDNGGGAGAGSGAPPAAPAQGATKASVDDVARIAIELREHGREVEADQLIETWAAIHREAA